MNEPEVALVFTADAWVEALHRHLTDHGGARVRSLVVEASVALEESYDVLVVSHRWPVLTRAFVDDVRARGRRVLGVYDLDEPASRTHLASVGVDGVIESDADADAFVRALVRLGTREAPRPDATVPSARRGRLVAVGGPHGAGRTEIAIEVAVAGAARSTVVLADCDDVAPAIAQRLALPIEPNLRTAIDAVEHGRGELAAAILTEPRTRLAVVGGVPNPNAWSQVRPGEVLRVIDRLGDDRELVVVDGLGSLQEGGPARDRFVTARAIARAADVLVAVCDASPVGVGRLLAWATDARALALSTPIVVVVNRAPAAAFRRGELYDEITSAIDVVDVAFVALDPRVSDAAWAGTSVARGRFTRGCERVATAVNALPRPTPEARLGVAS